MTNPAGYETMKKSMNPVAFRFFSGFPQAWLGAGARVIGVAGVFFLVFFLDTRNNGFSWRYHNDEPSKVQQILEGDRNLRHPPLMLTMVNLAAKAGFAGREPQEIVEIGRVLSALYMALAVALMTDWAWVMVRPLAGLGVALALSFHAGFFEIGHYFKEDAIFLFGMALVFRFQVFFMRHPGHRCAAAMGLALAVLTGTKYIAWIMSLLVLIHLLFYGKKSAPINRTLLLSFASGVLIIYLPALLQMEVMAYFLKEEVHYLFGGDYGAGLVTPHVLYFFRLNEQIPWLLLIPGFACFTAGVCRLRMRGLLLIPFFCLLTLTALAWTSKYSDRYLLPVLFLSGVVVVTGPFLLLKAWWPAKRPAWTGHMLSLGCFLGLTGYILTKQWTPFVDRYRAFGSDSREELISWVRSHLDPDKVVIAQDHFAKFSDPDYENEFGKQIFVADLGTLEEQRSMGITHVLISYDVYHRYVDRVNQPSSVTSEVLFQRRQTFYQAVLREGETLWSRDPRDPKALHPGLKLIRIAGQP